MAISATAVKELREKTAAGMMDCKKALIESNGDVQKAVDILWKKGFASDSFDYSSLSLRTLICSLRDVKESVRRKAEEALESRAIDWSKSAEARKQVPEFIKTLMHKDSSLRYKAERILRIIDKHWRRSKEAKRLIPEFISSLQMDEDSDVFQYSVQVLNEIDSNWPKCDEAKRQIPEFIRALGAKNAIIRLDMSKVLVKIGKPAVEPLIVAVSDENMERAFAAISALEKIGDEQAVRALVTATKVKSAEVRSEAKWALEKLWKRNKIDGQLKSKVLPKILPSLVKRRFSGIAKDLIAHGAKSSKVWQEVNDQDKKEDILYAAEEQDSTNYFKKGEAFLINGDLDEGIKQFREAIGLYPNITNQIYNVAYALHAGAESKNKAVGGNIYYSDGIVELDTAIAIMELLSEFESNKADVWLRLGVLYDNRCYFVKTVKAYEKAVNLDPEGPDGADALYNLGILYFNKGRGILGVKKEEASGYHAYSMNNDNFINAEKTALKALSIAQKVFSKEPSFLTNLINIHRFLREIYSNVTFEDKRNQKLVLKGETALEHCFEIYKLDPNDKEAITWLKQAEKNTGKKLL